MVKRHPLPVLFYAVTPSAFLDARMLSIVAVTSDMGDVLYGHQVWPTNITKARVPREAIMARHKSECSARAAIDRCLAVHMVHRSSVLWLENTLIKAKGEMHERIRLAAQPETVRIPK